MSEKINGCVERQLSPRSFTGFSVSGLVCPGEHRHGQSGQIRRRLGNNQQAFSTAKRRQDAGRNLQTGSEKDGPKK